MKNRILGLWDFFNTGCLFVGVTEHNFHVLLLAVASVTAFYTIGYTEDE